MTLISSGEEYGTARCCKGGCSGEGKVAGMAVASLSYWTLLSSLLFILSLLPVYHRKVILTMVEIMIIALMMVRMIIMVMMIISDII